MALKIFTIVAVQSVVAFLFFNAYLFFSRMFFGESANSFLYTGGNTVLWIIVPIAFPTFLNLARVSSGIKDENREKVKTYFIIELILLVIYVSFIIWWSIYKGFHI